MKIESLTKAPNRANAPTTLIDQDERDTRIFSLLLAHAGFIREIQGAYQVGDKDAAEAATRDLITYLKSTHEDADKLFAEVRSFAEDIGFSLKAHRLGLVN